MDLKTELLELENKIRRRETQEKADAILLHAKAHMFHNKKMHDNAVLLLSKYNIEHSFYDTLDD